VPLTFKTSGTTHPMKPCNIPEPSATPLWDHHILNCKKAVGHSNQLVLLVIGCGKDRIHNTRCEALTRVLLKMQVFWDVMSLGKSSQSHSLRRASGTPWPWRWRY
jgi:hypothetical protein